MPKQTKKLGKNKKNKTLKKGKTKVPHHKVLLEAKKVPKLFHHPTVGILSIPMTVTYRILCKMD